MARIAGDDPGYLFRLCRNINGLAVPTQYGFSYPSVTTVIGDTLGKPASAMSWWGFRIAEDGIMKIVNAGDGLDILAMNDAEELEGLLKAADVNPNMKLEEAGDRGNSAHFVLEMLANGWQERPTAEKDLEVTFRQVAEAYAMDEALWKGTDYGNAVISWWDEKIQPAIDNRQIVKVLSEVPVWSHRYEVCGSFDLAIEWGEGWEILDLKTHKPARGFTLPGKGPAYLNDVLQIRTYRRCFEEVAADPTAYYPHQMTPIPEGARTISQRVVIARENGKCLEDDREVAFELFVAVREAYDHKLRFEKKGEA